MGGRHGLLAVFAAIGLSACFVEVDYGGTRFRCVASTECPGSLFCHEGVCTDTIPVDAAVADAPIDACPGCAPGLVLRWTFNEPGGATAIDASGNGLDGTIENAARIAGVDGGAVEFDDTLDHVILATAPDSLKVQVLAIAARIRLAGIDSGEVVSLGDNYAIRAVDGAEARIFVHDGAAFHAATSVGAGLDDGEWHHVVGQYTGSQLQIYVDGVLNATTDHDLPIPYTLGASLVAGKHGLVIDSFDLAGAIDDIAIYDRTLDDAEIAELAGP